MYIYANVPFIDPASKSSETPRTTNTLAPEVKRSLSSEDHDGNNYFSIMSHLTIQIKFPIDNRAVAISIILLTLLHADDFIPYTNKTPSVSPAVVVTAQAGRGSRGRGRGLGPQQHQAQAPAVGRGGGLQTRQLTLPAAAGSSHAATSRPGLSYAPAERLRLADDNLDGNFP